MRAPLWWAAGAGWVIAYQLWLLNNHLNYIAIQLANISERVK